MRSTLTATLIAVLALAAFRATGAEEPTNPAAATVTSHIMVSPEALTWGPCSPALPAGSQCATVEGDPAAPNVLFTFRAKLPGGYQIAPHFHPADEHITVISGAFHMGMGKTVDRAAGHAMKAGSFMVMPKGTAHYAWTEDETIVQVHAIGPWGITYVNPADDPRKR
jgi:quercetin dioxygenase-like cupin family protein